MCLVCLYVCLFVCLCVFVWGHDHRDLKSWIRTIVVP